MRNFRPVFMLILGTTMPLWLFSGCGISTPDTENTNETLGQVHLALGFEDGEDDVEGFLFEIWAEEELVINRYVPLEEENLPQWLLEDGEGDNHRFSDGLFVLGARIYTARAFPMKSATEPSESCEPVETDVEVIGGETTEIKLIANCEGLLSGGLDVAAGLNHPPVIDDLILTPGKFIYTCEPLEIEVIAHDPDGDEMYTNWEVTAGPDDAVFEFSFSDTMHAGLTVQSEGPYMVKVEVFDHYDISAYLEFPVHVTRNDDLCENTPEEVPEEEVPEEEVPEEEAPEEEVPEEEVPELLPQKIIYDTQKHGRNELYLINPDGSEPVRLTHNTSLVDNWGRLSPDGSKIVYTHRTGRHGDSSEVYIMDSDGTNSIRLTTNSHLDYTTSWFPDGTKLICGMHDGSDYEIYIINSDGTGQTILTNNNADDYSPHISPDGSKIIFVSDSDGDYDIYVMDISGNNITSLTPNSTVGEDHPRWSPDGTKIVYNRHEEISNIYIMNADGSNPTQLTDSSGRDSNAWFSPDGTRLVFLSNRDGNNEVYTMNVDGSQQTRLTNTSAHERTPSWGYYNP